MSIFSSLLEKWHDLVYTWADYRTRDRLLMGSPLPIIAICIFYVYFIKIYLAKFMEWRKAWDTRYVSLALNTYLFATACYFFYNSIVIGWFTKYSWRCEPLDTSDSAEALVVVNHCYAFLIVKLTYMLETVVFVLGKKTVLVSRYHVFHHATLPLLIWLGVNYFPGGHVTFFALVNSITHMILLAYFVIVTAFPELKERTKWWKSTFNWLHIIQFSLIIIHGVQLFFWNFCGFPMILCYAGVVYGLCLFAFYLSSWL